MRCPGHLQAERKLGEPVWMRVGRQARDALGEAAGQRRWHTVVVWLEPLQGALRGQAELRG